MDKKHYLSTKHHWWFKNTYMSLLSTSLLKLVSRFKWSLDKSRTLWCISCNSLFMSSANRTVDLLGRLLRLDTGDDTSYSLSLWKKKVGFKDLIKQFFFIWSVFVFCWSLRWEGWVEGLSISETFKATHASIYLSLCSEHKYLYLLSTCTVSTWPQANCETD